jgi:hypothetical protein
LQELQPQGFEMKVRLPDNINACITLPQNDVLNAKLNPTVYIAPVSHLFDILTNEKALPANYQLADFCFCN